MTNRAYMVVSLAGEGREEMLSEFLDSWKAWEDNSKYDLHLLLQGEGYANFRYDLSFCTSVVYSAEPLGSALSRVTLLESVMKNEAYELFLFGDDDMLLQPETSYEKAIDKLQEDRTVGAVAIWFGRSENIYKKLKIRDEWLNAPAVNVNGGLVMRRDCAELILECEEFRRREVYDLFGLYLYVQGYVNYLYYGSACVHRSCRKGGLNAVRKAQVNRLPYGKMYGTEDTVANSRKVTQEAKASHWTKRKLKGWG